MSYTIFTYFYLPLKKLRSIFAFIFLTGMLYTVFQFIPILEEESASHRVEMAKKVKQNDGTDGESSNEDETGSDIDTKDDINYYPVSNFIYVLNYKHSFPPKHTNWPRQFETINTPPPRI